jgi:hypothetical protein
MRLLALVAVGLLVPLVPAAAAAGGDEAGPAPGGSLPVEVVVKDGRIYLCVYVSSAHCTPLTS